MQISAQHRYTATPDQVLAMMADRIWLTEVAKRAGAEQWSASVDADGSHLQAALPAPARAQKFTGATMKVNLTLLWGPLGADGSSDGHITVATPGMPASMHGTAHLSSEQAISTVDYLAEFTITVPLVGKTLEQAAAPYVRRIIDIQQAVGDDYLAGKLTA
ncbi:DUF2505 domain-containing protein [Propionimicrobium sp. PCR01-08-3]|uniref:DUF2505 domain-containing protein n=1 Tax=Propionimicrobium sp. PCR01-08-3 TaxID=3052086 RepID=UPI00255C84C8|nr:DUF2505 domain-containing protein [Propionimicrobium sp. PCR01-08-3]WIY83766.1 DUF2505 domain-containing protein [Propionimicrobium sp. PCR01-08-3]